MLVTDHLTITDKKHTADGYLVTEARFARTGIYEYTGDQMGKPEMAKVRVYRPEDEVFKADAMASFAHKPVTNDHPSSDVNASTWKRDAVGFTDGKVARDGDFIVIPMMVADEAAIADVDSGKRELSAGYACDVEFIDGTAPDGSPYDAVMRNIRGNHIAIVDRGRAGSECRIGDSFTTDDKEPEMQLKTIIVDGLSVETTPAGEQAIVKLQGDLNARDKALADADAAHKTAMDAKDKELATKDTEIADLKGKVLDAAALDKLVADRAGLVSQAVALVPTFDAKGKDALAIKREVVLAKCGDAAVKDRSDAYVEARYDQLVEQITDGGTGNTNALDTAIANMSGSGGGVGSQGIPGSGLSVADAQKAEREALAAANDLNSWRNAKTA